MNRKTVLTLVLALLAAALPAAAQTPTDYFVLEINGQIPGDLAARVAAAGGDLYRVLPEIGVAVAHSTAPDFAARIKADNKIKAAQRDVLVEWAPFLPEEGSEVQDPVSAGHVADPTTAFFYPCQWNMRNINAPGAWAMGEFGNPNVKVAVLDTGVDPFHQDLAGRIDLAQSTSVLTPGSSACGAADEQNINDFRFHGTFVASQITGNALGMAPVAPDTMVVGVKVLNCLGSGSFADVISGIVYAASLSDVDVINMSLGAGFAKSGLGSLVASMNKAVNYAVSQGKLVVSAAGNSGFDMDKDGNITFVPAQSGSGISVYATAWNDTLASYSNHGISGTWVGAGGGDGIDPPPQAGCTVGAASQGGVVGACSTTSIFFPVCGTSPTFYLVGGTGTSFAAPLVAGVAALVDGKAGGGLDNGQLKTKLKNSADDLGATGVDNLYSHGRVNAGNAVQ